jgi:hypothetical protein
LTARIAPEIALASSGSVDAIVARRNRYSKVQHTMLKDIRLATTGDQIIRSMIAAKSEGYTYEIIGIAAGLSRQAVF